MEFNLRLTEFAEDAHLQPEETVMKRINRRGSAMFAVVLWLAATPSHAECVAWGALGATVPAYAALLSHRDSVSAARAAIALDALEATRTEDLGAALQTALDGLRALSLRFRQAPNAEPLAPGEVALHIRNLGILAKAVRTEDCSRQRMQTGPDENGILRPAASDSVVIDLAAQGIARPEPGGSRRTRPLPRYDIPWLYYTLVTVSGLIAIVAAVRIYRQIQRRSFRRFALSLPVPVCGLYDTARLHRLLVDISRGGGKFAWQGGPGVGTRLHLHLPDHDAEVEVVWRNDFYVGVEFRTPLSDEQVRGLVQASHAAEQRLAGTVPLPPRQMKTAPEAGAA